MKNQQEYFLSGKERKDLISEITKKQDNFVSDSIYNSSGSGINGYNFKDSSLDGSKPSFFSSFEKVLPCIEKRETLRQYIEKILEFKKGNAIGIEFGGTGLKLFEGFTPGFFKKTIGVTLIDYREKNKENKLFSFFNFNKKSESKHKVIEGNILSEDFYKSLYKELGNNKVDLIIERMANGFELIPSEPYMLSKIFQRWYSLLQENGLMLIQTPVAFNKLMGKWVFMIQKKYPNTLDLQYSNSEWQEGVIPGSVLRLQKLVGAPHELEFLDLRTVKDTEKVIGQHISSGY